MPTHYRPDNKPVVQFDPALEISPFVLFRRLKEDRPVILVDVREQPGPRTLTGALLGSQDWRPESPQTDIVVFDDDGCGAVTVVQQLQTEGFARARALFGGLDLYEFSLDPQVVGAETFLVGTVDTAVSDED